MLALATLEASQLLSERFTDCHGFLFFLPGTLLCSAILSVSNSMPCRHFQQEHIASALSLGTLAVGMAIMDHVQDTLPSYTSVPFTARNIAILPFIVGLTSLLQHRGAAALPKLEMGAGLLRSLKVGSRLSLGINMCHIFAIHCLNVCMIRQGPSWLAPTNANA